MKKISVIVPVYNAEEFLPRCIDSIVNQTLGDIELILINDGSVDSSEEIINSYAQQYPDIIKAKTIENSGAAQARNIGLKMATGEFIGFVDSDDYITDDMYEKLYNRAMEKNSDIVVCGYYVKRRNSIKEYQNGYLQYYETDIKSSPDMYIYGVPYLWNKIFKREMVEKSGVDFSKQYAIFEDLEFVYRLYMCANKISKVGEPLYFYSKENDNSLTRVFSTKFFDIFPVMKALKDYAIKVDAFEALEEHLTYIAINHIYIRLVQEVNVSQLPLKSKYINQTFKYLNEEFPKWRESRYFSIKKMKDDKYKTASYWKIFSFGRAITSRKLQYKIVKVKKLVGKVKRYNGIGYYYSKCLRTMPVRDNVVLFDSQHGNDINGSMFYLIKEFLSNPEYKDKYVLYLGVGKNRIDEFSEKLNFYGMTDVNLVVDKTKDYMKLLATAKYLFSDTSFGVNFIKRPEQVYLNTWHGTPLKTLGRGTRLDYANIPNLQKNFIVADYLLYPSEYMAEHMLDDYMLRNVAKNKILYSGYPRNSVFLDKDRRAEVKSELGLDDKEIIVYMPTWRGLLAQKDLTDYVVELEDYLSYISENLKDNQILYVNVHPYVKDAVELDGYENIKPFPKQYETYDFLNIADCLITDYSSVFFDFAITGKKILLFTYDEQEYLDERGLYIDIADLPFKRASSVDELVELINDNEKVDVSDFLKTYCNYERIDTCKRLLDTVVLNKSDEIKSVNMPSNDKKNVLIMVKNFANKDNNNRFFELLENTDISKYNYYIGYIYRNIRPRSYNLLKLPREVNYMGQLFSMCNESMADKLYLKLLNDLAIHGNSRRYNRIMSEELKRIYGDIHFDNILMFGEMNTIRLRLFSKYPNCHKVAFTRNKSLKRIHGKMYDYVLTEEEVENANDLNELIEKK